MYHNSILGLPLYLTCDFFALLFLFAGIRLRTTLAHPSNRLNISSKPNGNVFVVISATILFLLSALRYDVGLDWEIYSKTYVTISQLNFFDFSNLPKNYIGWLGLPFIVFCKVISLFAGQNFIVYHAIMALITTILLYKVILSSDSPLMSLFLYISFNLFYSTFNQSRQGIAMLLVLFSYRYIREKKLAKFLITVGVAMCFHFSAFLAIIFYAVHNIRYKKFIMLLCIVGSCLLAFFWDFIVRLIGLTNYAIYMTGSLSDKYNVSFSGSAMFNLAYRCCLFVFCLFFFKQTVQSDAKNIGLYLICLLLIPFQILAVYSAAFTRTTSYVYIFYIVCIPTIYHSIKEKRIKQLYSAFVTIFFTVVHIYYYFSVTQQANGGLIKYYQTFFGNLGMVG
jgi:hypothetical protein